MKKISIRNLIIALLCITIIILSIGFGVLSIKLNNEKNKETSFKVVFTKVEEATFVKGGNTSPKIDNKIDLDGTRLNMNFSLYNPGDEIAITATIKNEGTIKAKLIDLVTTPDIKSSSIKKSLEPITIQTTDISDKVLNPGESLEVRIVSIYNQTSNKKTYTIPYSLSIISQSTN